MSFEQFVFSGRSTTQFLINSDAELLGQTPRNSKLSQVCSLLDFNLTLIG